jgi:hypothetical protein
MNKPQSERQNLGRVFNYRSGCALSANLSCYEAKRTSLKLKKWLGLSHLIEILIFRIKHILIYLHCLFQELNSLTLFCNLCSNLFHYLTPLIIGSPAPPLSKLLLTAITCGLCYKNILKIVRDDRK